MKQVVLITGASSGFGEMTAYALADAGYTVYASMRGLTGSNAKNVEKAKTYSAECGVDIRTVELDVQSQPSVDAAVAKVIADAGRIDVLIHNAGHMAFGPAEAFTPEQFLKEYDINVVGAQRLNRAALPHMRRAGGGSLVVWIGSTSTRGGTPPYLAPYFAAKAAMDSLAVSYAGELALWGIETVIVVPGVYTKGTNHFPNADHPEDTEREAEYNAGPTRDLSKLAKEGDENSIPETADPADVARATVKVINLPFGRRPFRVTVDAADGGAEEMNKLGDRIRADYLKKAGMGNLLHPCVHTS